MFMLKNTLDLDEDVGFNKMTRIVACSQFETSMACLPLVACEVLCTQQLLRRKKRWDGFAISRVLFLAEVPTIPLQFDNHSSGPDITVRL